MDLQNLEQRLKAHVIGQSQAVEKVCQVVRRSSTGVRILTRPLASFLFTGPPGVGKTKLAHALATEFYPSGQGSLIRFNMIDCDHKKFVSQLVESITLNPRSVILFHKIENACPSIAETLLRIIDEGTLTDSKGRRGDFRNAIIVMTSNYGEREVRGTYYPGEEWLKISEHLREILSVDLLNRADEFVLFREVTRKDVEQMVEVLVTKFTKKVRSSNKLEVEVTHWMKNRVVEKGYDFICGAKPLNSAFARLVEDQLADAIVDGRIKSGGGAVTLECYNVRPDVYQKTSNEGSLRLF